MMLTARQAQLLKFIHEQSMESICPSFEEMKGAMGLASKSGIHRMLLSLEQRGFIRRGTGVRSIEVIRLPGQQTYHDGFRAGYAAALRIIAGAGRAAA